jgi:hypothetical protein
VAIKAKPRAATSTWTVLTPYQLIVDDGAEPLDAAAARFYPNAVQLARGYASSTAGHKTVVVHDVGGRKRGLEKQERRRELRRLGVDPDGHSGQ